MEYIWTALVMWNIAVFFMYGADKKRAVRDEWRISELTLIVSAFCMGGLGALFGMRFFRHKTQHIKFAILVPLSVVLNLSAAIYLMYRLK